MTQWTAPPGGYIVDASTLGLIGGEGSEQSRSFLSGMIVNALRRTGPSIRIPAVCLLVAAVAKPLLAEHIVRLTFEGPDGTIEVDDLGSITVAQIVPVASADSAASLDVWHAAYEALAHRGWTLVTSDPKRYAAWPDLNLLELS